MSPVEVRGWWKDTGKAEDILDANRLELLKLRRDIRGELDGAEVVGDVIVEEGATVRRSTILGPALIGAGALIEHAFIGPYTTIGNGAVIRNAEIEYAVVGDGTHIEGVKPRIEGSLIGEDVHIAGHTGWPSTHRLILGDKSRVMLPGGDATTFLQVLERPPSATGSLPARLLVPPGTTATIPVIS